VVNILNSITNEGKKQIEDHCQLLQEARTKVDIVIAERLTNYSK
jgi:hypothetical protein